jgi:hypothetical protein
MQYIAQHSLSQYIEVRKDEEQEERKRRRRWEKRKIKSRHTILSF